MSEIPNSVWNQDRNGEWKLYFNTESENSIHIKKSKEEQKSKNKLNISDKNLILGTLAMTPKGIGRIIKNQDEIAHVRFTQEDNKEYEFPSNEILHYFNCYITLISKNGFDIFRLKLKPEGKISDIISELIKLKKINQDIEYNLIFNKKILSNENSFEQINLCNNSKILIFEMNEIERKISRFSQVRKYGYSYEQDGISFSPSENIKLSGIGLYCSFQNKIITGIIKILEGTSISGKVLLEENVEIMPSNNELNFIYKIKFSKKVFCRKNMDYSISFITNILTDIYHGSNGKTVVEGERGLNFTFKKFIGNRGGTSVESGNFPEIYYYLN